MRHNEVRDFTAGLLCEVSYDVEIEPKLQPLAVEELAPSANRDSELASTSRHEVSGEDGSNAHSLTSGFLMHAHVGIEQPRWPRSIDVTRQLSGANMNNVCVRWKCPRSCR